MLKQMNMARGRNGKNCHCEKIIKNKQRYLIYFTLSTFPEALLYPHIAFFPEYKAYLNKSFMS